MISVVTLVNRFSWLGPPWTPAVQQRIRHPDNPFIA
jgi:hypothetical protein